MITLELTCRELEDLCEAVVVSLCEGQQGRAIAEAILATFPNPDAMLPADTADAVKRLQAEVRA